MLNLPKKEDGNTFSVDVQVVFPIKDNLQNEIINDLSNCLDSTRQLLMDMTNFFSTRANYISNVMFNLTSDDQSRKNPYIADFKNCVELYDSKQYVLFLFSNTQTPCCFADGD